MTLDELKINQSAIVEGVGGSLAQRLFDLGIVDGTKIKALFKSPCNDPVAYLVRGTVIALRRDDAKYITIKRED